MKYIIKNINDFNTNDIYNFYNKIPKIKKNKIDKYIKEEAKIRSIIGEYLLKCLLKEKNIDYSTINYYINDYGKQYIKNINYYHNISHSYDYVITVLSDKEIGVDIEKIRDIRIDNIKWFASKKEKEYILKSNDNINKRLFEIYTLKEAYFKSLGKNLNNILEVEFIINDNKIICSDKNIEAYLIYDIEGYIIAIIKRQN